MILHIWFLSSGGIHRINRACLGFYGDDCQLAQRSADISQFTVEHGVNGNIPFMRFTFGADGTDDSNTWTGFFYEDKLEFEYRFQPDFWFGFASAEQFIDSTLNDCLSAWQAAGRRLDLAMEGICSQVFSVHFHVFACCN